ncbi:MAG: presenilin family intramembrane aspartyl protease [Candidatus Micrarchaeota archaeon]
MKLVDKLLLLFILAQVVGIFTGVIVLLDIMENPYVNALIVTSDADDPANAVFFIAYILAGAIGMILAIRLLKLPAIFRFLEIVLIAGASSIVFYSVLRLAFGFEVSMLAGILFGLALSAAKFFRPGLKNFAVILATAGVGVVFGVSLGLIPLILFLILLSIYDYSAVFFTKHMVELADYVVKKDLAFTITAREKLPGKKEQRIDLGTGDLIAPIMLEVSTLAFNPVATAFVFIGSLISMALFLGIVWKKKMVLPALPPIVAGMIIFLLLGMLLGFY